MSGPGLDPKTIPQPASEPSKRRAEEKIKSKRVM